MAQAVLVRVQSWAPIFPRRLSVEFYLEDFQRREADDATNTEVAELVDAHVSGACAARREGSSPSFGTKGSS